MRVGILYWTCTSVKLVAFCASADHSLCLRSSFASGTIGSLEEERRIIGGSREEEGIFILAVFCNFSDVDNIVFMV